jgi:hypothetical protein
MIQVRYKNWLKIFMVICLIGFCVDTANAQNAITKDAILAKVKTDLPKWRQNLPAQHPRLFFTPDTWKGLRARYANAQGREKQLFDDVLNYAADISKKRLRPYRSPLQLVSAKNALASAQAELWQRPIGDDIVTLSLALALRDNEDVRNKLRETVIAACNYPTWGIQSRGIHLATSSLARGLAVAYDWDYSMWTNDEKALIRQTIKKHVDEIEDGLLGNSDWGKGYDNNHNHVAVAGMGMAGVAFLDEIPEASEWVAGSLLDFDKVAKTLNDDGSTNEGVAYWSYSLTYILQYIEGTRNILGTNSLYQDPFFKNAINYRLNSSTSGFGSILPWGDVSYGGYGPHFILYKLASEFNNPDGQYMADNLPQKCSNNGGGIAWTALWYNPSIAKRAPVNLDYHAQSLDIVTSRGGWTDKDYLLSVKSGIASHSHTHLDLGAIILGFGDEWLLTTPGYGTGKSEGMAFWARGDNSAGGGRWAFFSNATESESTLLINGANQVSSSNSRGTIDEFISNGDICWTGVNLTNAYGGVSYARREVLNYRNQYILVFDDVKTPANASVEWLAQVPVDAMATADRVDVKGKSGASLQIKAVWPAAANFTSRAATSKFYDLPRDKQQTYELMANGSHVQYVVALLPAKAGQVTPVKNIAAQNTASGLAVTVTGSNWTDHILITGTQARVARTINNGTEKVMLTVGRHPNN